MNQKAYSISELVPSEIREKIAKGIQLTEAERNTVMGIMDVGDPCSSIGNEHMSDEDMEKLRKMRRFSKNSEDVSNNEMK
jgi:hypothetical protein